MKSNLLQKIPANSYSLTPGPSTSSSLHPGALRWVHFPRNIFSLKHIFRVTSCRRVPAGHRSAAGEPGPAFLSLLRGASINLKNKTEKCGKIMTPTTTRAFSQLLPAEKFPSSQNLSAPPREPRQKDDDRGRTLVLASLRMPSRMRVLHQIIPPPRTQIRRV